MIEQKERSSTNELIFSEDTLVAMPVVDSEETAPEKEKKNKKRRRFLPFLAIYASLLLIVCAGLLIGFSNYLVKYEAATPNAALDEYINWIKTENFDAIYAAAGFSENIFNNKQDYLHYFQRIYGGSPKEITLRERPTTDENRQEYALYFDDTRVDILDLISRQDGDGWTVVPQLSYQEDYTIYAAPDTRITVNGQDISLLGVPSEPKQNDVFYGLHTTDSYPTILAYTLSGFLNPPTIEALTLSGESCALTTNDDKAHQLYAVLPLSSTQQTELENMAIEAAFTYAKFIARDAGKNSLLKLVHKDSSLYDSIRNFSNVWFPAHDSYEFKNVRVHSVRRFTEQDFYCEVEFEPYYTTEGATYKNENAHYKISFLKFDDVWKLIALTPVQDTTVSTTTDSTDQTTTSTTM